MPRADLLALTAEDLVILSNRGLVRRAQQELQSGELTFELLEDDTGTLTVRWSDGAGCVLPAQRVVGDGRCNCDAVTICRHLIRSVLAYQQAAAAGQEQAEEAGPAAASGPAREPWDPGAITDEELARHFRPAALQQARAWFEEGHVIELVRTSKPNARIHTLSCSLRFLVPGDIRYTHCDCAEPAPCRYVPLVIWAFRLLGAEQVGGLVTTRKASLPVPTKLLDEIGQALMELVGLGVAGAPSPLIDRLRRLEARCRDEGLIWPAEILAEIVQQQEAYVRHDSRFSPLRLAELIGELRLRSEAIRSDTGAVPQLFLRGASSDRVMEVRSSRMVGLGCEVQIHRSGVEIAAYLQDPDTGAVVAVSRDFPNPPKEATDPPRAFWELARTPVIRGISLAALGTGQLLTKGGKRSPAGRFIPGRAEASLQPQSFQWEMLRSPVLVESYSELQARLAAMPPASFRPRRVAENLIISTVAGVAHVEFAAADQHVAALLHDAEGNQAALIHPYTERGREGAEALLSRLSACSEELRFVAGRVRLRAAGLMIAPIALVFQEPNTRSVLQPWVDRSERTGDGAGLPASRRSVTPTDPIVRYPGQVMEALGELLLLGLDRADERVGRYWQELHRHGAALGFVRFLDPMNRLIDALEQKSHTTRWDWQPAAGWIIEMAGFAHLAAEEALG